MAILDLSFSWPLDERGYEIAAPPARARRAKLSTILGDPPEGPRLLRRGGPLRWHRPLEFHPTLFLDFTKLAGGPPEAYTTFASRFGYLGFFPDSSPQGPSDLVGPGGEPLLLWEDSATRMRDAVEAWRTDPMSLCQGEHALRVSTLDVMLAPSPPDGRPSLRILPRSLIGAMWLQFAQHVSSGLKVKICSQCANWFEVGGDARRIDAQFCSDACRVTHNNLRKRRAK